MSIVPLGHHERVLNLKIVGVTLSTRYENLGKLEDLDAAIEATKEAVAATAVGHPLRRECLEGVRKRLYRRFRKSSSREDLGGPIAAIKAAIVVTSPEDPAS